MFRVPLFEPAQVDMIVSICRCYLNTNFNQVLMHVLRNTRNGFLHIYLLKGTYMLCYRRTESFARPFASYVRFTLIKLKL